MNNPLSPQRRRFLQTSLLTGATAAALPALAGAREIVASPAPQARPKAFELDEATIADLQAGMASGKYTAHSITQKYLGRIEEIDKHGPALASVIEVNPDALAIADGLDKERAQKHVRGPMHGIPVLIKDNIDTADRMQTTAGSLALLGSKPARDSFVAQRLREAGAVILGKTNLSEWANIRSSHSTSGWSGRGGQTRNPYALDRNPCGSSSGSGAATAANLCAVAVGTETDGSVVCPASANGLVGIKPTLGLVSRSGIIPIAHSQDTAGPDGADGARRGDSAGRDGGRGCARQRHCGKRGESGDGLHQVSRSQGIERRAHWRGAEIFWVQRCGGRVDEPVDCGDQAGGGGGRGSGGPAIAWEVWRLGVTVLLYELKADLNAYLAARPGAPGSLKEIIDFNERRTRAKRCRISSRTFSSRRRPRGRSRAKEYTDALEKDQRLSREEGIDAVMDEHKLDAIMAPTAGPAWFTDWVNGDCSNGGSSNAAAVAGYPDITVPAGFIFGLPVGVSFFGRAWSEGTLLKIAYGFEQLTKVRKGPEFLGSVKM